MSESFAVERIFTEAWEKGYIRAEAWDALLAGADDEATNLMASRLMHAVRRGRLFIVD